MNVDETEEQVEEQNDIECQGCDSHSALNDLGLCEDCAEKLDRDLIRLRNWEHSVSTVDLSAGDRENFRKDIITQHGKEYELILPKRTSQRKKRTRRKS
ncbi:MAG: hypothetical protein KAH77_05085 [Thiomargarita sp.]|nr:hypothetical protein [Thiomargarita sp.]